jgi:hypothetical protein
VGGRISVVSFSPLLIFLLTRLTEKTERLIAIYAPTKLLSRVKIRKSPIHNYLWLALPSFQTRCFNSKHFLSRKQRVRERPEEYNDWKVTANSNTLRIQFEHHIFKTEKVLFQNSYCSQCAFWASQTYVHLQSVISTSLLKQKLGKNIWRLSAEAEWEKIQISFALKTTD